jgi:hypothetical protein
MTIAPSKATAWQSAELLRLAERVEGLTGPDGAIADEILLACGWVADSNDEGEIVQWFDPSGISWSSFDLPDPTSSLDAAMSLLGNCPIENMSWWSSVPKGYESEQCCRVTIRDLDANGFAGRNQFKSEAATPALALTAACLRARAAAARGE